MKTEELKPPTKGIYVLVEFDNDVIMLNEIRPNIRRAIEKQLSPLYHWLLEDRFDKLIFEHITLESTCDGIDCTLQINLEKKCPVQYQEMLDTFEEVKEAAKQRELQEDIARLESLGYTITRKIEE